MTTDKQYIKAILRKHYLEQIYGPMVLSNENWKIADCPLMEKGSSHDWVAQCGVCLADFAVPDEDGTSENPGPHGTFCPDCRENKAMAPGVLNWHRRKE